MSSEWPNAISYSHPRGQKSDLCFKVLRQGFGDFSLLYIIDRYIVHSSSHYSILYLQSYNSGTRTFVGWGVSEGGREVGLDESILGILLKNNRRTMQGNKKQ